MKVMPLQKRGISDSRLVLGCMGLGGSWDRTPLAEEDRKRTAEAVEAALSIGITMFDHADIYCRTKSETVFGEWLAAHPGMREKIVLQSKCGIILSEDTMPGHFNFSRGHILQSVDGILERLGTGYLDVLLLHRPDPLMEPDEIAEVFLKLSSEGKVRHFGVSNMGTSQMRFIQSAISQPLVVNQLQLGLGHLDFLDQAVSVNQERGVEVNFGEGILEYCQTEDVQLQAWGPLDQGKYTGRPVSPEDEVAVRTVRLIGELAEQMETTPDSVVLGWLMRHPAKIQPVIGSTRPERIIACQDAAKVAGQMTREEWYKLYVSARGDAMP